MHVSFVIKKKWVFACINTGEAAEDKAGKSKREYKGKEEAVCLTILKVVDLSAQEEGGVSG